MTIKNRCMRVVTFAALLFLRSLATLNTGRTKSEYANALADYNISYARLQKAMGVIN